MEIQISAIQKTVDYLWEHKVAFLLFVASLFFALHGYLAVVDSFSSLQVPGSHISTN